MELALELETLRNRIKELRKQSNKLFASQVELRINLKLMTEKQEELLLKNQYLIALSQFLLAKEN